MKSLKPVFASLTALALFFVPRLSHAQAQPAAGTNPAESTKPASPADAAGGETVIHLLNGKDLNEFYPWLKEFGVHKDRHQVFSLTNGVLRISGENIGYLATKTNFMNYRLVAEFKWGEKTWTPRAGKSRNSGIFVHAIGSDKVWMRGLEIQIQEGATGDVVLQSGAALRVGDELKYQPWATFERPGKHPWSDELGFRGPDEMEKPHGEWNTVEIVCDGDLLKVAVNGRLTVEGKGAEPQQGQILLQSNGAEIFFRRLDLYPFVAKPVVKEP